MIEITLKARPGEPLDTMACLVASMLYNEGFDVSVDSYVKSAFTDSTETSKEDISKARQTAKIAITTIKLESSDEN